MLGQIDLGKSMDKQAYKEEIKILEEKLEALEQTVKELKIPVIIMFEGWSASGKGTFIGKIVNPLDPRCFNVYTMSKLAEDSVMRPFLWRYWIKTPAKGRFVFFDKSWHRIILPEGMAKSKLSEAEKDGFFYDVNSFEKQLVDDGALIIKFFIHIDKDEQKRRFKELEKRPSTEWRVDEEDWQQNKDYDKYLEFFNNMIRQTNNADALWTVVEANDKRYATVKIYKTLINKITEEKNRRLRKDEDLSREASADKNNKSVQDVELLSSQPSILGTYNPNMEMDDKEYKHKLEEYQSKVSDLVFKLYAKRKAVAIVYEGWDAAGKGGNIKRLTEQMDPRGYEVVPIMAPSTEELNHHYLWRFYNKLPKDGHVGIFDRSWYGRVMVERIEGLCTTDEWKRAYKEINDMEKHWANHGIIIFKFWLQIDKDEQLRRFQSRQEDPLKQYKITAEDWRNRDKWDMYEEAINEMLMRTNTEYAPWTIVESNNKKYARIKVLEYVVKELQKRLD